MPLSKKPVKKPDVTLDVTLDANSVALGASRQYGEQLVAIGLAAGLDRAGITSADILQRARTALTERKALGLHNQMEFTYRNPMRSTDPTSTMASAKSVIVGARSYSTQMPDRPSPDRLVSARVARYAWRDYYEPLRDALRAIAVQLKADGWRAIVFADGNSIVDREVAYQAGLGWYGKNANLLIEGAGSYFVLGSVVTDAPLVPATKLVADGCGACRRCVDNCPTQAIVAPGVVDAHKCLAWLLQKPGVFDIAYREVLGDRLYGCDDCQEVCPPTVRHGEVQPLTSDTRAWVPVIAVLLANDAELLQKFDPWYIADRDPKWLRRNALVILGNVGDAKDSSTHDVLVSYLSHADPILRSHAVWAAARLGLNHLLPYKDADPIVQAELDALPTPKVMINEAPARH
ncbi:MAG: tRNA epoxyqueuosine(34) reductase QueG [Acidimicrobiaceae bacterium]|nr:tRNA epoxyqueuosine(34) reductase QueG [Acidimicrobiaceae bacterium]